jgi:hypothetical protein
MQKEKTMKTYFCRLSIISWIAAFFASSLSSSSLRNSLCASSMTDSFPFPFDFDRVGSASLTFGVALVVHRISSRPRDVDASSAGTLSLAGR